MSKIYIEELEDTRATGVTTYSLVKGMDFYYGDVRASGVTILTDLDGTEMKDDAEDKNELYNALYEYIMRGVN